MDSQEFVLWLKGFTEGVHDFSITPKQWDLLKERLAEVEDKTLVLETPKFPFGTPNTAPIVPLPYYPNPLDNPFKVTCRGEETPTGTRITTTPNTQGYITTYNPITFTTTGYPSGSNVTYTTSGPNGTTISYTTEGSPSWYSINKIENDSREK